MRIVAGPFAGAIGVLVGTTPSGAAQVRLTVAGEGVTVELPSKDCAAIH